MRLEFAALLAFSPLAFAAPARIETTQPMIDVTLVTNDLARAREFYGEALGLKPAGPQKERSARFQIGTGSIHIMAPSNPAAKQEPGVDGGIGIRGLALFLPDAGRFAKSMVEHGMPEPSFIAGKGGAKLARVHDPDGNWLELIFAGPAAPADILNQILVILMVRDEAKSREFYGKTLGIPETAPHGKPETGLLYAYTAGKSTVLVKGMAGKPVRAGKVMDTVGYRSIRFTVKDLDGLALSLQESGVPIPVPPHGERGARTMYAADPDGNYLEFVE